MYLKIMKIIAETNRHVMSIISKSTFQVLQTSNKTKTSQIYFVIYFCSLFEFRIDFPADIRN